MLSRRIDLTTELSLEEVERIESRVPDAFLATKEPEYEIPPSRITLRGNTEEARKEAERIRYKYILIAFEPERRRDIVEVMKCPFIDAISFDLDKAYMIDKGIVHLARINKKALEIRFEGDLYGIRGLLRARHRLTVKYVPVYFGSGAKRKEERADPYAIRGFFRRVLNYDLLSLSARRQREIFIRNSNRIEGRELSPGVRSIKNLLEGKKRRNGADKRARDEDR